MEVIKDATIGKEMVLEAVMVMDGEWGRGRGDEGGFSEGRGTKEGR